MRLAMLLAAGVLALGCTKKAENAAPPPSSSSTTTPATSAPERETVRGGQRLPSDTSGTPGSNVGPTGSHHSYDGTGKVVMPTEGHAPGTSDVIGRPGSTAQPTAPTPTAAADGGLPANPTGSQGRTDGVDTTASPGTTIDPSGK